MTPIAESLGRISRWLEAHGPTELRLRPPAEATAPPPLAELYAAADGQHGDLGREALFDMHVFLPLADALREKAMMDELARAEGWPESWWSPRWHPFASDGMGQLLVVDEVGGEVLEFLHDDEPRPVMAPSIAAFLESFAGSLERGERTWSEAIGIAEVSALRGLEEAKQRRAEVEAAAARTGRKALVIALALSVVLAAILIALDRWLRG